MINTPTTTTASPPQDIPAGAILGGRFRVMRLIGRGAMGGVYLARDTLLTDELVALKVFVRGAHERDDGLERFIREVQIGRKIAHPNVCRIFDLQSDKDLFFVSMEYIPGQSLGFRLKEGAFTELDAIPILRQIAEGLAAIHFKGIVHRDVKPSNIILSVGDQVKIIDFGLARMIRSDLTDSHSLMGTAMYLAPELWDGADPSFRSDLYAFGVLAYQMLTGVLPFERETMPEMMKAHLDEQPRPPSEMVTISSPLEDLILRLIDKDPRQRPLGDSQLFADVLGVSIISRRHSGSFGQSLADSSMPFKPTLATSPLAVSRPIDPGSATFLQMVQTRPFFGSVLLGGIVATAAVLSGSAMQFAYELFGTSVESPLTIVGAYVSMVVTIQLIALALARGAFRSGLTSNERVVREHLQTRLKVLVFLIWLALFLPLSIRALVFSSTNSLAAAFVTSVYGASLTFIQIVSLTPIQSGVSPVHVGDSFLWAASHPPSLYCLTLSNIVLMYWVYSISGLLRPPRRRVSDTERQQTQIIASLFLVIIAVESAFLLMMELFLGREFGFLRETPMSLSAAQIILAIPNCGFLFWANLRSRAGRWF